MLEAIRAIEAHVGSSLDATQVEGQVVLEAVLLDFVVIGEAAKYVGDGLLAEPSS